jgi:predicted ATPase
LWETHRGEMARSLAQHDAVVRAAIESFDGVVFATGGDGMAAAFGSADMAVRAACAAQRGLRDQVWGATGPLRARMALNTGTADERDGDYFGPTVNRTARLMAIGHGGQVLLSQATAAIVATGADQVELVDLGEHRLRDLWRAERVFQVVAYDLAREFPPLRSLDASPTNLPRPATTFIGRDDELTRVADALECSRLVTLTGVGGVGKTRLALEAAARASSGYPDGVWLADLSPLVDSESVIDTVAGALRVQVPSGRPPVDSVAEFVASRQLLLVLDNCEHLIEACADLVSRLMAASDGTRVLATSREGLAVAGERVVPVGPLALPAGDGRDAVLACDAVRLFVDRATEARPDFDVSVDDSPVLAKLCERVDGIALAIELAAARVRSMSTSEILAHLDHRFRLLSAGRRSAPTRQQTLRAAIDWSYDLLDDAERMALRRLSVFTGSFDLTAAEAVAGDERIEALDVADLVDRLVDKSLLLVDVGNRARFRLLEMIRDYSIERLDEAGETVTVARRHAAYFLALAERMGAGLRGPDEIRCADELELELDNLRVALTWAIATGDADTALRLVGPFGSFGQRMSAAFGATGEVVAGMDGAIGHPLRPLALGSAAWAAVRRGDQEHAIALAVQALAESADLSDSPDKRSVRGRIVIGVMPIGLIVPSDLPLLALAEEGRAIATELADPFEQVQSLIGNAAAHTGLVDAETALRLARDIQNPSMLAYSMAVVAMFLMSSDPVRARQLAHEAGEIAAQLKNIDQVVLCRNLLAAVETNVGDNLAALQLYVASVERAFTEGDTGYTLTSSLWGVAHNLEALGDIGSALVLATYARLHGDDPALQQAVYFNEFQVTPFLERIAAEDSEELQQRVAAMTDDDVVALVRERIAAHTNEP